MDTLGEGGAEQNLLTLVRHLRAPRCEHWLAWLYDEQDVLLDKFRPHVTKLIPLHSTHGFGHLGAIQRLSAELRANPPDLVHGKLIRAQLVARTAAMLAGRIPMITTWECVSYRADMYNNFRGAKGLAYREVTRGLDVATGLLDRKFIAVSNQVADHNARALAVSPKRVIVNYNAIDPSRVIALDDQARALLRQSLALAGRGPVLLSVGRLVEQKRHDTAIAAMPKLAAQYPEIILLIAGGGDARPLSKQINELGMGDHVRLLGPRTDVPELLQVADAFVFPSEYEGLGIALMEALAAGLPVAASRIPTSLEVAAGLESVLFFQPLDASDLARAVSEVLIRGPELRASARAAAPGVSRRFSAEAMAEGFWSVAERAMSN